MKVNFNTFNFISPLKTFQKTNVSVPTFKSQPVNDVFIRTVPLEDKKETKQLLPKYLYHLTNKKCHNAIIRSGKIKPSHGWTNKFIFPPYIFSTCDSLITNFHPSQSAMLMLVASFGGYDLIMEAYKKAIEEKYRFLTYGDAMLIL